MCEHAHAYSYSLGRTQAVRIWGSPQRSRSRKPAVVHLASNLKYLQKTIQELNEGKRRAEKELIED